MNLHLPALLLALAACGGAPETAKTPGGGGGSGSGGTTALPGGPNDVAFDAGPFEIKGVAFDLEALERPGMMLSPPKQKTTIEKLRDKVLKTKDPETRQALAIGLATMLYEKAKADAANADKLIDEARQALRDAVAAAGDKPDDLTLRILGVYELYKGDFPNAEKAWGALVQKFPTDKEIMTARAWWALSLLKQYKNQEALAAVKDQTVSDKQPELAYVTAWAKWRTGDDAGAWQAIVTADKGWAAKELPNKQIVDRDLLLFAARTNVSFTDAAPQLLTLLAKDKAKQYEVLAKLGLQAYSLAGRWADGVAAIDKAIATAGNTVPLNDTPVLRYTQADFTVRLDTPEQSAVFGKQAIEALPACGTKCSDKDKADLVQAIYTMGRLFHLFYATANDQRYFQPAHDLYAVSAPIIMSPDVRNQALKDQSALEQTQQAAQRAAQKNPGKLVGTHDKQAIGALLQRHNQEGVACYEAALAGNPKIAGSVALSLEVDQGGAVKGASTEPKAGLVDMAAVAGCLAEHAKAWKLPKRGIPGMTRIKVAYSFGPQKK